MKREKIICIFCGKIAQIKEQDDLKIVLCPKCKRETELDTYQVIFDKRYRLLAFPDAPLS